MFSVQRSPQFLMIEVGETPLSDPWFEDTVSRCSLELDVPLFLFFGYIYQDGERFRIAQIAADVDSLELALRVANWFDENLPPDHSIQVCK